MSSKHSRVLGSRPKLTGIINENDSEYEGEPASSFPPLKPIRTANGQDDGVAEEDNVVINNHRGKYRFDDIFNKVNLKTPLPHAATTYARVLESNMRKFRTPLEEIAEKIKKSNRFYITLKLGDITGMPSESSHPEYETFINLLAFHGYRITRDDKGPRYEHNTLINIICIPGDK